MKKIINIIFSTYLVVLEGFFVILLLLVINSIGYFSDIGKVFENINLALTSLCSQYEMSKGEKLAFTCATVQSNLDIVHNLVRITSSLITSLAIYLMMRVFLDFFKIRKEQHTKIK